MPSDLRQSVRNAVQNFVKSKTSDDAYIPIDVLRMISEEATLQMERQLICDTFDSDPFKFYADDDTLKPQVERLKKLMTVQSCERCSTGDGFSTIEAVVELRKDAMFRDVEESVKLTFNFRRMKVLGTAQNAKHEDTATTTITDIKDNATQITYTIDYSKDHGPKQRLVVIEVFAKTDHPSVEAAVPVDVEEGIEMEDGQNDDDDNTDENLHADDNKSGARKLSSVESGEDMSMVPSDDDDDDDRDRYQAYADPDNVEEFLHNVSLRLNAENALFFLMTFPYYEHEWDVFGFLLNCVFGGDSDSEGYEDMSDSD